MSTKWCPLTFISYQDGMAECIENECGWWNNGQCAITRICDMLHPETKADYYARSAGRGKINK